MLNLNFFIVLYFPRVSMKSKYEARGVSADMKGRSFEIFSDELYPYAFSKIHYVPGMPEFGYIHHPDGAGSKPVQNYLNWKETGDLNCFRGVAQDALSMSLGDVFAAGIPEWCSFVDIIDYNRFPFEMGGVEKNQVMDIFAKEWYQNLELLRDYGINIKLSDGETADLPDQTRTLNVAGAMFAWFKLDNVLTGEDVKSGDLILGVSSGGQAVYETRPAGVIMANGLTLARGETMKPEYGEKYPETRDPHNDFTGRFSPTDIPQGFTRSIGKELTAPTRLYAPVFKGILEKFGNHVHGIVFNTGGGQTKCLRLGKGIRYVKDNLPEPPEIFKLVKKESGESWRNMHKNFNLGVGADIVGDAGAVREMPSYLKEEFNIESDRTGECRRAIGENKLRIESRYGNFDFRPKKE
jgi:phosphoribosylformylglycinamidine cyclo-ligase